MEVCVFGIRTKVRKETAMRSNRLEQLIAVTPGARRAAMPRVIEPMLATLVDKPFDNPDSVSEKPKKAPQGRNSTAHPNGLGNRKAPQGRDSTAQGIALG